MSNRITIIFLSAVFCFIAAAEAYSDTEAGRVLAVKKQVYVIRNEKRDNAEPKMPLMMKDAVETEKKSRTKLFFTDDSILNLGELSRVEVEEYLYSSDQKKSKSIYRLIDGYLKVVVGKSELEIHTPTAVIAARGTKFIVSVAGTGIAMHTNVIVLSGKVLTWNAIIGAGAGIVPVSKGESSTIPMNSAPSNAKPSMLSTLEQFSENTAVINETKSETADLPALVEGPTVDTETSETVAAPPPPPPPAPQVIVEVPPVAAFTALRININF